jgi:hypothetical protein
MITTGPFRREIREALLEAYPLPNDLRMLVEDTIGEPLVNISMANDMPTVAFDLINWARARGLLTDLILGATAQRPRSERLKAVSRQFQFVVAAAGEEERIQRPDVPFQNAGEWGETYNHSRAAICRVEPQPLDQSNEGYGTGFLVLPDVVLTNFHVVDSPVFDPRRVVLRFDCEIGQDKQATPGRVCGLADHWKLATSPRVQDGGCDYALLRLAEPVGGEALLTGPRGVLRLRAHAFRFGQPVFILQHAAARPLELAIGTVTDPSVSPVQVAYDANTEGGSSGSPCFNAALQVVALHHFGGPDHNRGVKAESILRDLSARDDPELRRIGSQGPSA